MSAAVALFDLGAERYLAVVARRMPGLLYPDGFLTQTACAAVRRARDAGAIIGPRWSCATCVADVSSGGWVIREGASLRPCSGARLGRELAAARFAAGILVPDELPVPAPLPPLPRGLDAEEFAANLDRHHAIWYRALREIDDALACAVDGDDRGIVVTALPAPLAGGDITEALLVTRLRADLVLAGGDLGRGPAARNLGVRACPLV